MGKETVKGVYGGMAEIRQEADRIARERGHKMTWRPAENLGDGSWIKEGFCEKCGRFAVLVRRDESAPTFTGSAMVGWCDRDIREIELEVRHVDKCPVAPKIIAELKRRGSRYFVARR